MSSTVNEDFVRRAVEEADLSALRMALIQATGDPEIIAMQPQEVGVADTHRKTAAVPPEHHDRLKDLAVAYLLDGAADHERTVPSTKELNRLVQLAHERTVADENLKMRRDLLAFGEYPLGASWTTTRPEIPEGFGVVIIGAGFCGIGMAVQLQRLGIPYTVLERRHEIGGVWSTNTYPDARVDTPSNTYQFGFVKNYPWSEHFARQPEVRGYLEHVAKEFGVFDQIRFCHDVVLAEFDESASRWMLRVTTDGGEELDLTANVVISAAGLFATPKPLEAEGLEDFTGEVVHTTAWTDEVHSAEGKRVAVVGNGSTGVQLLGRVAESADKVFVFQRTPQWISPREKYGEPVTPETQWLLDTLPYYWNWNRYITLVPGFDSHHIVVPDPEWIAQGGKVNQLNDSIRTGLTQYMKHQLGERQDLLEHLVPDYAPLTRRPIVDNGWYRALTRENVELVPSEITRFTTTGIVTPDGQEREVDLVVTAVGFHTSMYLHPTDYLGVGGASLQEVWGKDGPRAHLGMTVPGFPNFFMLYGPNSQPLSGGGSLPAWFEIWTHYIAQCLITLLEGGHAQIEIRKDTHEDYNTRLDEAASGLVHLQDPGSQRRNYYLNEWGRMQVNAPFNGEWFYRWSGEPDLDHFTFC